MSNRTLLAMFGLVMLAACAQSPKTPLPTLDEVALDRYVGTWYEIAMLPNRFQSMCARDTQAHYAREGDQLRVVNRCSKSNGEIAKATGIAKVVPRSGNAKLRVSFFRPFYGDYWILALDPDYRWVLVGEPGRKYGWILSRAPKLAEDELASVLDRAEFLGYERSRFVRTVQTTE